MRKNAQKPSFPLHLLLNVDLYLPQMERGITIANLPCFGRYTSLPMPGAREYPILSRR